MGKVLVVLDSVGYDVFVEADTPVLDSLGEVHKAISYGQFTTPSMAAMLIGYLPRCTVSRCFHNGLFPKPFYNVIEEALRRGWQVYTYTSNPFVEWLLRPRVYGHHPNYHFEYPHTLTYYTQDAVTYLVGLEEDFFALIHVMSTHDPYFNGREHFYYRRLSKEESREKQKVSLHNVDSTLKPLVDGHDVIVCGDHGELHPHGHPTDVFDQKLFEVPIISNKRGNFFG